MGQKNKNICDIRLETEEEATEERLKSDRYCNWKNADYGTMGCPDYHTDTQCGEQVAAWKIDFINVKSSFKVCPFCGKPINFL